MLFLILPFVYLMRQIGGEVLLGVIMFLIVFIAFEHCYYWLR